MERFNNTLRQRLARFVRKTLYLRQFNVPFDALAYVFGRELSFWYRVCLSLGRPSLLGSTVKHPEKLPQHLVADEKHTWLRGERIYIPTTAASSCILGATVATSSDTPALTTAYEEFAKEAKQLNPSYAPKTVCTDGWEPTQAAWRALFPKICLVLCFLHSVLKIVEHCVRDLALRRLLLDKAWDAYEAVNQSQFSQRLRRFREWARKHLRAGVVRETVLSLCRKGPKFARAYAFVGAHRTSNEVDRLMNYQDRVLYTMRYFHGKTQSARLAVRSMAMLWNFHPYGARLKREQPQRCSPFHDLNGFQYHSNWLHNLLLASSLGGRRRA